jgi:hypothetical protein
MALGTATIQPRFENPREILGDRLREGSIYRLLADEGHKLFPPEHLRVVDRAGIDLVLIRQRPLGSGDRATPDYPGAAACQLQRARQCLTQTRASQIHRSDTQDDQGERLIPILS